MISSESVVNWENIVFTFPERVFILLASVLIAVPNPTILPDVNVGSIFVSDLFTMNENRSRGELRIQFIFPL